MESEICGKIARLAAAEGVDSGGPRHPFGVRCGAENRG
jgi:hypothetical protein